MDTHSSNQEVQASKAHTTLNDDPANELRQDYEAGQRLYQEQPPLVRRFLEAQARNLAEALIEHASQLRFTLPDKVFQDGKALQVPGESRDQMVGGVIDRLTRSDIRAALRNRLLELEQSSDQAVVLAARLIRHAASMHMVHNMLPSGRTVTYLAEEGEEIPTMPAGDEFSPESAITAASDAIALKEEKSEEVGRGELIVPYIPYARRFYLPQWIAFDEKGNLLGNSVNEAEAHVASMQRFLNVLHTAVSLTPYMVADDVYQEKRYGILGQLVNQGRALARYIAREIIATIQRRAAAQDLNRGLSLSLPYFDDRELVLKTYDFEVIPAGRIMFVPAFVVRASRQEQAKVAQDTRLSPSTRRHLLAELETLEEAFFRAEDWQA
ncbi:MAG: hypothetical protein PHS96_08915 [Anaerolineales bacterium]|nr:hypothetical protein [Anaerolineales bacterium]